MKGFVAAYTAIDTVTYDVQARNAGFMPLSAAIKSRVNAWVQTDLTTGPVTGICTIGG